MDEYHEIDSLLNTYSLPTLLIQVGMGIMGRTQQLHTVVEVRYLMEVQARFEHQYRLHLMELTQFGLKLLLHLQDLLCFQNLLEQMDRECILEI